MSVFDCFVGCVFGNMQPLILEWGTVVYSGNKDLDTSYSFPYLCLSVCYTCLTRAEIIRLCLSTYNWLVFSFDQEFYQSVKVLVKCRIKPISIPLLFWGKNVFLDKLNTFKRWNWIWRFVCFCFFFYPFNVMAILKYVPACFLEADSLLSNFKRAIT